jgi:hypothetical protein
MGWASPQPAACFIIGDTITVPTGGTNVNGGKPLVLVAHRLVAVAGVLDVASHLGDMVSPPTECRAFSQVPNAPEVGVGGSGGAGGSFMTRGGNGGLGESGSQSGQANAADVTAPTHLRGGCSGQAGGALAAADAGIPGAGGGSVYLVSGGEIDIQRAVNASGSGGGGGNARAGGSGGGAGGMIVLHSPMITWSMTPVLIANGGGGGSGSQGAKSPDGTDPSVLYPLLPVDGGGNGGSGYPVVTPSDADGINSSLASAGGGGGGGAAGYIRSNKPLTGVMVSPPADIVP